MESSSTRRKSRKGSKNQGLPGRICDLRYCMEVKHGLDNHSGRRWESRRLGTWSALNHIRARVGERRAVSPKSVESARQVMWKEWTMLIAQHAKRVERATWRGGEDDHRSRMSYVVRRQVGSRSKEIQRDRLDDDGQGSHDLGPTLFGTPWPTLVQLRFSVDCVLLGNKWSITKKSFESDDNLKLVYWEKFSI